MRWVEIITLRSPAEVNTQLLDELLQQALKANTEHPVEIRMYQHSILETDLTIHIYWETKPQHRRESPLGQQFSYALKGLGLLNHSMWVETTALEFVRSRHENPSPRDIRTPDTKDNGAQAGPKIAAQEE
jgi:hypothetical protein